MPPKVKNGEPQVRGAYFLVRFGDRSVYGQTDVSNAAGEGAVRAHVLNRNPITQARAFCPRREYDESGFRSGRRSC